MSRAESDKIHCGETGTSCAVGDDALLAGLIVLDPARAAVLCG